MVGEREVDDVTRFDGVVAAAGLCRTGRGVVCSGKVVVGGRPRESGFECASEGEVLVKVPDKTILECGLFLLGFGRERNVVGKDGMGIPRRFRCEHFLEYMLLQVG